MQDKPFTDVSTAATPRRSREESTRPACVLTVISHPTPRRAGERLVLGALAAGLPVSVSRVGPDFVLPGATLGMPLADTFISRKPLVFEPAGPERVRLRVEEGGTPVRVGTEPVTGPREFGPEALREGVPLVLADRVVLLLHLALPFEAPSADGLGMVGHGQGTRRVREDVIRVADLKVPVLIRGETGSGKELVARAIHQRSPRRNGPFVSVNLGAIPKELAAAELFGARKGAYTGAHQEREGFFRAAHGGTLFLDEVGEAPPEVQVMLLRALETGEVYPVGGSAPVAVDTRLITATDADLEARIVQGAFKAPLLHRLAGYDIQVPPLRERREDIGVLFQHFAREELASLGEGPGLEAMASQETPWLPASLAVRLVSFAWPGNVRQLRNFTRQIVIGSRGQGSLQASPRLEQELEAAAAPAVRPSPTPAPVAPAAEEPEAARRKPSEVSDAELLEALRASAWDLKAAAQRLGITRPSLYVLIEKSPSLRTAGDLSVEEISRCYQECQGDLDTMARRLEVSKRGLQRRVRELGLGSS
ncbi:sigma 54-interacting transcriptional regulator [Stigmatella erecta]|uniref:Two-component system, NtrC family, nitrogen regulation response regulator GlnG n=1 Tax=Stigmatella erecta TaxID=83460 RepID=A0A1I0L0E1_9BACT|nr:sigma 54-interacting transcriptional regulator [Stigmatella erecta]SEU32249.1 two-component system, NtrC family, nitrogen regulation response regulator GlnG [Stigmatella erecta]